MDIKTKNVLLNVLILVSIIGAILSSYLLYNHYAPASQEVICTSAPNFSCSAVNTSKYAQLFDLPVALYGVIWFVFLGLLSYAALKNSSQLAKVFWWNIPGFIFVLYLVAAEFLLKTICLLCTAVHVLVLAAFIISTSLYISQYKSSE